MLHVLSQHCVISIVINNPHPRAKEKKDKSPFWSEVRVVDLNKAHLMQDNLKLMIHLPKQIEPLIKEGWYFGMAQVLTRERGTHCA